MQRGINVRPMQLAEKVFSSQSVCPTAASQLYVAHGLLGNAGNWTTASRHLVEHPALKDQIRRVIAVDMRNHGSSAHSSDHTNAALASDLEALVLREQQGLKRTFRDPASCKTRHSILIGHSMGGLAVMGALLRRANEGRLLASCVDRCDGPDSEPSYGTWSTEHRRRCVAGMRAVNEEFGFAPSQPISEALFYNRGAFSPPSTGTANAPCIPLLGRVAGAIIVDVTPTVQLGKQRSGGDSVKETLERMTQVRLDAIHNYKDAAAELIRVGMADQEMRNFVATNIMLDSTDKSKPARWRCNLPVLAGDYGSFQPSMTSWFTSSAAPSMEQASSATAPRPCMLPVMFVFGGKSPYNVPEDRHQISHFFPNATQVEVAGAGHFVHYEKPNEFTDVVAPFIASLISQP